MSLKFTLFFFRSGQFLFFFNFIFKEITIKISDKNGKFYFIFERVKKIYFKNWFCKKFKDILKKKIIIAWNKILQFSIKIFPSERFGAMNPRTDLAPVLPWRDPSTWSTHHSTYARPQVWIWGWAAPGQRDPRLRSRSRRCGRRRVRSSPQLRVSTFCWRFSQLRGRLGPSFLRICRIAIAIWKFWWNLSKFHLRQKGCVRNDV